jgi:hypothetical protein
MRRDLERRCITAFLLTLFLCVLTLAQRDPKELAILLTPVTALLLRVVRFYFPVVRKERKP